MFEFNEQQRMIQSAIRSFCEKEIAPHVEAMEKGEMLPYDLMRKMAKTFGFASLARRALKKAGGEEAGGAETEGPGEGSGGGGGDFAADPLMGAIIGVELSRVCPGFTLAVGASVGLCGNTILSKGTAEQKKRWGIPVVTMEKVGCWGLTEPDTGSDAFGLRTTAVAKGEKYVLNGSKTLITNAPYADVFVVYAKIDHGDESEKKLVHGFILERGMKGLSTGKPFEKMGMWSSPTGEIFLEDVEATREHLLGGKEKDPSRSQAVSILEGERSGSPVMALGIIERCLEESLKYAKERRAFGKPIAEYQLVQAKLARMYMVRNNVRNLVFQMAWMQQNRKRSMIDACAAKLYCGEAATQVALEAIQILGGMGYLREGKVERFMRDAKLLEIGGGTNEIQMLTIARHMLRDDFRL